MARSSICLAVNKHAMSQPVICTQAGASSASTPAIGNGNWSKPVSVKILIAEVLTKINLPLITH